MVEDHINCNCSLNPLIKEHKVNWLPNHRSRYGHYEINCEDISYTDVDKARRTILEALRNTNKKKNEQTEDKGENVSGIRIKKTDEMTIDEFKENIKAYDMIKIMVNKEKFDKFIEEYGAEPFVVAGYPDYYVSLRLATIEFKEKAIKLIETGYESKLIPYYFIDKVIGIYYIECES